MKVAVIHWPTSSVGGINSRLQVYHHVATKRGDTFHVLVCSNQRTKRPGLFSDGERHRIRGGDSFIVVDGEAPHHASNYQETYEFIAKNYDVVMLSFLCPHPTKEYGPEPLFLPLLKVLSKKLPLIGYVSDAYFDTYKEFAEPTLPLCEKILVAQKAYGEPLVKAGYPVTPVYLPFAPIVEEPKRVKRDPKRLVWTPQFKNIKGVHKFFAGLPDLVGRGFNVGLYNCGIEYYKLRLTPEWKKIVDADDFVHEQYRSRADQCKVVFHGCIPLEEIPAVLLGASFACDFQGHSAKHKAYLNGSYNNTINEMLYYGTVPVVHANMLKSDIPNELLLAVDRIEDYPEAVAKYPLRSYNRRLAREFIEDKRNADRLYDRIFKEVRAGLKKGRSH
jgi:hypothetical protein